jgi:hypothetical protein
MKFNITVNDKQRHVLVLGESKQNSSKIIQSLILEDLENGNGAVYITSSQMNIELLHLASNNNPNIIEFTLTNPIDINEEMYKIKELNLRALMDNGKVFVLVYNTTLTKPEDVVAINKLILTNIIEHAQARIDGKEYDKNHDLIDKQYYNEASKFRKPFFIYIEDCYQYLTKEILIALEGIRLSRVGMIFGLVSDGNFVNTDYRLLSLKSNTGTTFYLKSKASDLAIMELKLELSKLKQGECLVRIMKDGMKGSEYKIVID